MKPIKINAPEGFKGTFDEAKSEINFVEIKKTLLEHNWTFEEVCQEMNRDPKSYICNSDDPDEQQANATKMALLIARFFNQGVELDWSNSNQKKWLMYLVYDEVSGWSLGGVGSWRTHSDCCARLHFVNPDHVRRAWELFPEVYKTINNKFNN